MEHIFDPNVKNQPARTRISTSKSEGTVLTRSCPWRRSSSVLGCFSRVGVKWRQRFDGRMGVVSAKSEPSRTEKLSIRSPTHLVTLAQGRELWVTTITETSAMSLRRGPRSLLIHKELGVEPRLLCLRSERTSSRHTQLGRGPGTHPRQAGETLSPIWPWPGLGVDLAWPWRGLGLALAWPWRTRHGKRASRATACSEWSRVANVCLTIDCPRHVCRTLISEAEALSTPV